MALLPPDIERCQIKSLWLENLQCLGTNSILIYQSVLSSFFFSSIFSSFAQLSSEQRFKGHMAGRR